MNIQKGNIVRVGLEKYDVLSVRKGFDCVEAELHKIGDFTMHPTHLLKFSINEDNNCDEVVLLSINQEKSSDEINNPKEKGRVFSYGDKRIFCVKEKKVVEKGWEKLEK